MTDLVGEQTVGAAVAQQAQVAPVTPRGHPMDLWISRVLRAGVLASALVIGLGLILYVSRGPSRGSPMSLQQLLAGGGHPIVTNPALIVRGVFRWDAGAVIQLGVLALILTPVVRVAMTLALFLLQQDRVFTAITATVLVILVVGLIGVGA